ncbi:hypothetical protein, partial [Actinoalloteichus caeruleus]|uniref:hypothetical protein n=1 Tax=Actinoalloteichus cyanogriseus TaxID=2893586 RepID=UPI001B7FF514
EMCIRDRDTADRLPRGRTHRVTVPAEDHRPGPVDRRGGDGTGTRNEAVSTVTSGGVPLVTARSYR